MYMAKIIHTGDLHLDSAFRGLSSDAARLRRQGLREVFSRIIDIANAEAVDALILAGDIFDAYPIRPETESSLLHDLKRAKCRVFITPGNHDPLTPTSPYATLPFPENVHIFKSSSLSSVELPNLSLRMFGAAYTTESYDERILDGFRVPKDDFINIIILHSNLYTDGYSPVSSAEIAATGADYVALAHIHKPTEILSENGVSFAYCGCPEARDFGECYDTAIYIGEVTKGSVSLSRRAVSDIRYREASADISENANISKTLPPPAPREFLRLTLTGEVNAPDIDGIYDLLSDSYEELAIIDRTTAPRDIWEGLSDDGLRGLFLRKMKAALDSCTDENERRKIELAARFGIDAIENRDV